MLSVKEKPSGGVGKSWLHRLRVDGLYTHRRLGSCAIVSLRQARELAARNCLEIKAGNDPFERVRPNAPTLRNVVEETIEHLATGWKPESRTAKQWRSTLLTYAYPKRGRDAH